ncbi:hypothetical protein QQ045_025210 [Rhodiola kirilowii]
MKNTVNCYIEFLAFKFLSTMPLSSIHSSPASNLPPSRQPLSKLQSIQTLTMPKLDYNYEQSRLWSPFIRPKAFLASPTGIIVCTEGNVITKIPKNHHNKRKSKRAGSRSPSHWLKNLIFGLNVYVDLEVERILLCFGLSP